jgi:hypothetical protein
VEDTDGNPIKLEQDSRVKVALPSSLPLLIALGLLLAGSLAAFWLLR